MLAFLPSLASALKKGDYRIIITGASGWLGQATLEMCDSAGLLQQVHAFGSKEYALPLRSGKSIAVLPLSRMEELTPGAYHLFHYAFLGKDRVEGMSTDAFISENQHISETIFKQADRLKPWAIFVPSSGAVYKPDRSIDTDIKNNPYGVLKARDEKHFAQLKDSRVVQCRIFNLAGPFINKPDIYALGSIIHDIKKGGPIVLKADKPVLRSYMHVADVINLALAIMQDNKPLPPVFDTAGDGVIEIGELAARTAKLLGAPFIPMQRPDISGAPNRYVGDGAAISALMKHYGITPANLDTQILDTARYLGA